MSADAPRRLFFYELCRLCLENEGTCNIFESSNLAEDIFACTGVKVTHSDNLPHNICVKCSEVVKSWKELRFLATKNEAHLRTLFGSAQADSEFESDILQSTQTASTSCVTPSNSEPVSPEKHLNGQISSKKKLCLLLEEGEKTNKTVPVITQMISLRKDLFSASSQCTSPAKTGSPVKKVSHDKLLRAKVEEEKKCKRIKTDDDEDITYDCEECDKKCDTYKKLYLHQRLHNKKLHCPLDACGKKFATKGDMEKHIRTHTGEKPFRCTQCEKSFSQRVSLRQHVAALHSKDLSTLSK